MGTKYFAAFKSFGQRPQARMSILNLTAKANHSLAVRRMLLGIFWFLGMLIAVVSYSQARISFASMMRLAVADQVSIVSLIVSVLLPYLLSAFAVYISKPLLLLPIAFLRGFSLMLVLMGTSEAFGNAGWLVRSLFLFSDLSFMPFLYLFWHRSISGLTKDGQWVCCAVGIFIACLDYRYVSPFLVGLLS